MISVRCGDCGAFATWTPTGYACARCGWEDDPDDDRTGPWWPVPKEVSQ